MFSFRLSCVLVLAFLYYIHGKRRIIDGFDVKTNKQYMVYLVQAVSSTRNYSAWICGGCIISRWYILTSAACVEDVQSMYAIAGSKHYVSSWNIFTNACTQNTKKKVVFTCVPIEYTLDFDKIESWSYNDIAVVKVETPYDSNLELYEKFCDYKPMIIKVNFDVKNEERGTEVMVLGYGHKTYWRGSNVNEDWNNLQMQYSPSIIENLENCKNSYKSPNLGSNIDKYMICTKRSGHLDETGMPFVTNTRSLFRRRNYHEPNFKIRSRRKNNNSSFNLNTRRHGFCQNDHGGPLVTWINGEDTVIGVASVFRVTKEEKCTGPYLYTSTARNQMFIECIINDRTSRRSNICNRPASELGFSISRRYILWNDNENHVVDKEEIRLRPQINMNFIGQGVDLKK